MFTLLATGAVPVLQLAEITSELAVDPGVMVTVHEAAGAKLAPHVEPRVVPLGKSDELICKFAAVTLVEVLVTVICLGKPVAEPSASCPVTERSTFDVFIVRTTASTAGEAAEFLFPQLTRHSPNATTTEVNTALDLIISVSIRADFKSTSFRHRNCDYFRTP